MKYKHNDWMTPLDQKKFNAFCTKVNEAARREFGVDQDGDCPVQLRVTDRTRFEPVHYLNVPYGHKFDERTPHKVLVDHLATLVCNMGIASEAVKTFVSLMRNWDAEREKLAALNGSNAKMGERK